MQKTTNLCLGNCSTEIHLREPKRPILIIWLTFIDVQNFPTTETSKSSNPVFQKRAAKNSAGSRNSSRRFRSTVESIIQRDWRISLDIWTLCGAITHHQKPSFIRETNKVFMLQKCWANFVVIIFTFKFWAQDYVCSFLKENYYFSLRLTEATFFIMGERKGQNKYYPPDYDPKKGGLNKFMGTHALRERAKKLHLGILIIRFEMPYNIWCEGCGNHIGMGVR